MMALIFNTLKIFGIVFLRFRFVPRVWNVWLVGVNLACLYFIQHFEAQLVLGTTLFAVVLQAVIYEKMGFTRLLGIAHLLWIPMFTWLAFRLGPIAEHPALESWLVVLALTNAGSFIIDTTDVFRFVRGERAPHYVWS